MSIQKLKKGFTLIELMVVIVIIGILAAIAIPKLFGMSAKAKAQEVGPAVGTWAKMQQAYKMETGNWGGAKKISYKLPGDNPDGSTTAKSKTSNFEYTIEPKEPDKADATTASLAATNLFAADGCGNRAGEWKGSFTDVNSNDPTTTVGKGTSATASEGGTAAASDGCEALTPNFKSIGAVGSSASAAPPAGGG